MSDTPAQPVLAMPPSEQLAADAVAHLATEGYRSQVMSVPQSLLHDLAQRLVTPGSNRADVHRWLGEQLPAPLDQNAFYRFAQRFGEAYRIVWGQRSAQILMAALAADPAFDQNRLEEFTRNRVHQLIAQELIGVASPDELTDGRLRTMLAAIRTADDRTVNRERLALDRELAQQRADRLAMQLRLAQQRLDQIPEQVARLRDRLGQLERAIQSGHAIDPSVFASLREELIALARPPAQPESSQQ